MRSISTEVGTHGNLARLDIGSWSRRALHFGLTVAMIVSGVITAAVFAPELYYRLAPADTEPLVGLAPADESAFLPPAQDLPEYRPDTNRLVVDHPKPEVKPPPVNPTLPAGSWVSIPRIGVRTQLRETENPEEALNKGVWKVPGYGGPGDRHQPLILVSHRFGWDSWWQSDYWRYHSFYQLPELEEGDVVEVIADQRKWLYRIYDGEEGSQISSYDADLILYTCKFLNSPVRHFRYAKLVDDQAGGSTTISTDLGHSRSHF
ncbi:MAG: hypothetical protein COU69_04250 [Candidatus Pacebacteria bacterium CG10_big_fil_rev_8_21_14_0_10_56_10]|nr:MAG: hypothetical protein COU69_04250 [Candidatus Pacebacteria bacterium CG10_big_fil_rev_8_21_14_0_10_56_10]